MSMKTTLIVVGWLALGFGESGAFRASMRHDFSSQERDSAEARSHEIVSLFFGLGGPLAFIPMVMFTGMGAYGWENPLGPCYWQARAYGEECKS